MEYRRFVILRRLVALAGRKVLLPPLLHGCTIAIPEGNLTRREPNRLVQGIPFGNGVIQNYYYAAACDTYGRELAPAAAISDSYTRHSRRESHKIVSLRIQGIQE